LQLDKSVVGNGIEEIALHVLADIKQVIILEIVKGPAIKTDHHGNNLALRHLRFPVSLSICTTGLKLVILNFILIFCTKIVGNTKNFNNFVCCDYRVDIFYLFDFQL
jgi:hypothetical protein